MSRTGKSIFLAATAILVTAAFGQAQLSPKEQMEALWINLPSSPLQFSAAPNGAGYEILNQSTGRVLKYQLGCVVQKNRDFKVIDKRSPKETSLPPRTGSATWFEGAVAFGGVARPEPCERGRLAFLAVWFEDGAIWRALQKSK